MNIGISNKVSDSKMQCHLGNLSNTRIYINFLCRFVAWCVLTQILLWLLKAYTPFVINIFQANLAWLSGSLYGLFGKPLLIIDNILLSQISMQYLYVNLPCLGLGMCAGLISLQLAIRSTWRRKLIGICSGIVLLQVFNCIRIAHLFSILETDGLHFDYYHLFIWQSANVVVSLILNVVLILMFHPNSLIAKAMNNTYTLKALLLTAIFSPVLFIEQALATGGGGGGGGGSGSSTPFIDLQQWQFSILIGVAFIFIKSCLKNVSNES